VKVTLGGGRNVVLGAPRIANDGAGCSTQRLFADVDVKHCNKLVHDTWDMSRLFFSQASHSCWVSGGAVVRFGTDRLEVDVPRRLQVEQLLAPIPSGKAVQLVCTKRRPSSDH
jgi:hypothetical protein